MPKVSKVKNQKKTKGRIHETPARIESRRNGIVEFWNARIMGKKRINNPTRKHEKKELIEEYPVFRVFQFSCFRD